MGMFRDTGPQEADIVKEMAESLGSSGLRLEELIEKANLALDQFKYLLDSKRRDTPEDCPTNREFVNKCIREYNNLVDQAENALAWLLIQREACGFRTHRNVRRYYPIPSKIKPL